MSSVMKAMQAAHKNQRLKERIDSSEDIAKMRNETAQDRLEQQERFKAADLRKE